MERVSSGEPPHPTSFVFQCYENPLHTRTSFVLQCYENALHPYLTYFTIQMYYENPLHTSFVLQYNENPTNEIWKGFSWGKCIKVASSLKDV
jgi:hypothetical protein